MRDIHPPMLAAVLEGGGLRGLAELAASEAGGPVAIVLPARGLSAASLDDLDLDSLSAAARRLRRPGIEPGPRAPGPRVKAYRILAPRLPG